MRFFLLIVLMVSSAVSYASSFTIIALPDTQKYSRYYPETFYQQTQWIVDNAQTLNIAFVTHLGDIVDRPQLNQWQVADQAMDKLDDVVPYSVCIGNHDYDFTPDIRDKSLGCSMYLTNFGPSRYAGYSWYGGSCSWGTNHYQIFTAGGITFLHLNLEMDPSDASLLWAQDVLDQHPNLPVIYSSHAILRNSGVLSEPYMLNEPPGAANGGALQWEKLIKKNNQIFLALNGHWCDQARLTKFNDAGNEVFFLDSDYGGEFGGNGYLRILNFDIPNNKIDVKTYSPKLNAYRTGDANEFTININFTCRFIAGNGTAANPYQISTLEQLEYVNQKPSASYILINDINVAGKTYQNAVLAADTEIPFTGTFDGNGYSIKNLIINGGTNDYIGFFGRIGAGATVKNLGVEDISISGHNYVGCIAGQISSAAISNCHVAGVLTANQQSGGFAGDIENAVIESCYAGSNVRGRGIIGGFVGVTYTSIFKNCYATGLVTSTNDQIGGFVGDDVTSSIESCYSIGRVTGGAYTNVGGFAGSVTTASLITKSFWDKETSGKSTSAGAIGKTTTEMKTRSTFINGGWDFETTWAQCTDRYPILRGQTDYRYSADFDGDCAVGMTDLWIFAQNWLSEGSAIVDDLGDDDIVDFKDFTILASEWFRELE